MSIPPDYGAHFRANAYGNRRDPYHDGYAAGSAAALEQVRDELATLRGFKQGVLELAPHLQAEAQECKQRAEAYARRCNATLRYVDMKLATFARMTPTQVLDAIVQLRQEIKDSTEHDWD